MSTPDLKAAAQPVRLPALFAGLGAGLLLLALAAFFLPVEWSEAKLRFRLWRAGARPVLWEKHRGFTADRCAGKPPAECVCVWMIHGLGDSVTTWRNVFLTPDAFGDQPVRLFALDLPSHGGSFPRKDPAEYRVTNIARELDRGVAATSECTRNALIGNSFGGWVAARIALAAPTRYERLVLIAPAGLYFTDQETTALFQENTIDSLKEFQRRAYFHPRPLSDAQWEAARKRMRDTPTKAVREAQTADDRLDADLGKVSTDTVLIRGEADQIISEAAMQPFARLIPRVHPRHKILLIPECGHLPQKECPTKLFPLIQRALAPTILSE